MADDIETNLTNNAGATAPPDTNGQPRDKTHTFARYVEEITLYERETQRWDKQSERILKRYKDWRGTDGEISTKERRFNVLWSNTQNLLPALYARNPKPDVQRRFKDADPVGRVTSDVLERCISYYCDTDNFAAVSRQCVLDYLLPGRGTSWVRYDPHFKPAEEITDDIGPGDQNKEQAEAPEVIDYEDVINDYVHRGDFGHNVCRTWDECWLVFRKVYLTRKELKSRFKNLTDAEIASIPLDYRPKDLTGKTVDNGIGKAIIYECWDKIRRVAVWGHKSVPRALDERPDPLRLHDFFPCPKPLLANLVNDSLIPTPIFVEYQDQANELDDLTNRIAQMTKNLKVVGVYDASAEGLNRMFNEGTENELIPVAQWAIFAGEKGGMKGAMEMLDVSQIAEALLAAYKCRDQVEKDLDQITGMSDIIRGETEASETATAQKLKAGFAGQRISDLQKDVQRYIRETIRIMADVICNHFQDETIKQISGVRLLTTQEKAAYQRSLALAQQGAGAAAAPPLPPNVTADQMQDMMNNPTWEDVFGLLRNNALRCFRIDIETDSTIKPDEQQEKADAVEFVQGLSSLFKEGIAAGQQDPDLIPLVGQIMQFSVRRFSVGKEFESAIASYITKKEKEAQNPQPKPNPEMAKVQADAQLKQQEMQQTAQIEQAKMQFEAQAEQQKANAQIAVQQHLNELENQRRMAELQGEQQLQREKMAGEQQIEREKMAMESQRMEAEMNLELQKAYIQKESAIEVARISAKATTGEQEEARAESQAG